MIRTETGVPGNKAYPSFRKITLEDKPFIEKALAIDPPEISEMTFTNIYSWREPERTEIAFFDGAVIFRSMAGDIIRYYASSGDHDPRLFMSGILEYDHGVFVPVPERTAAMLSKDARFSVREDRDNFDYLYRMEDLVVLPGKKFDGKRNLIRKFKTAHAFEYLPVDGGNAGECLGFEEAWCDIKECDKDKGLSEERVAFQEMVRHSTAFGLTGGMIKIGGKISAVAISGKLNANTMVMYILKADPGVAGLYQTMMNEFLARNSGSAEFVNLEQDLGIDGLRKAKLSFHPVRMIKKYEVSLK
ncbi:MAG: DUF2156 domain-containing protein [Candidatus Omnitrophica bacterium]|nr:DUF2156 domain-containing protein [Candidatus Omnitrophota bacterium]